MYTKIIVPLDGSNLSEQALPHARVVAKAMSIPIHLVEAFDIIPQTLRDRYPANSLGMMLGDEQKRSEKYLSAIRKQLEAADHSVAVSTLPGKPADAIVALAGAAPDALIVMSTHGRSGVARWALGSVADTVLRTASNPTLIVSAGTTGPAAPDPSLKPVLVPLDGSALAELALPHASQMGSALGAGVSLLRVTPTVAQYRAHLSRAETLMSSTAGARSLSAEDLGASDSEEVAAYLSDLKGRLADDGVHVVETDHRSNQNVAQAIIDKAKEQASMVVMATHGRSGLGRLALGSITDRVVRHPGVPVLVIRQ